MYSSYHPSSYRMFFLFPLLFAFACAPATNSAPTENINTPHPPPSEIAYRIDSVYKRPAGIFTQGFAYLAKDIFVESSGLYGKSFVQEYDLKKARSIRQKKIAADIFAEGICTYKDLFYLLTWREGMCMVLDKNFKVKKTFPLAGEGWGITRTQDTLIVSTGGNYLDLYDAKTFTRLSSVAVFMPDTRTPVKDLNELEYIDGYVYANVWQQDWIAKIDLQTGAVVGRLDFHDVLEKYKLKNTYQSDMVLNGIAWDKQTRRMFLTGKLFPYIFALELL